MSEVSTWLTISQNWPIKVTGSCYTINMSCLHSVIVSLWFKYLLHVVGLYIPVALNACAMSCLFVLPFLHLLSLCKQPLNILVSLVVVTVLQMSPEAVWKEREGRSQGRSTEMSSCPEMSHSVLHALDNECEPLHIIAVLPSCSSASQCQWCSCNCAQLWSPQWFTWVVGWGEVGATSQRYYGNNCSLRSLNYTSETQSRNQTPPSREEKGLVDIERFLGSAVVSGLETSETFSLTSCPHMDHMKMLEPQ